LSFVDDAGGLERRATPLLLREAWQKGVGEYGFPKGEPWEADVEAEPLLPISCWTVSGRLNRYAYLDFQDECFEMKEGGGDQLGGWEQPIQQVMHGEVELIASGTGDVRWDHPEDLSSTGERWRHVMTINGETYLERLMPTWGDGAMFMFVDEAELGVRLFNNAVGTSQFT